MIRISMDDEGLIASGLPIERFTFHGFLPAKAGQRKTALEELVRCEVAPDEVTHVFYEAPHRILDALADVEAVFGASQHVVVARELTKVHEEFLRGQVAGVRSQLAARAGVRGEIVLMLAPSLSAGSPETKRASLAVEVAEQLHRGCPLAKQCDGGIIQQRFERVRLS